MALSRMYAVLLAPMLAAILERPETRVLLYIFRHNPAPANFPAKPEVTSVLTVAIGKP